MFRKSNNQAIIGLLVTISLLTGNVLANGQEEESSNGESSHFGFGIDLLSLSNGVASLHAEIMNPKRTFALEGSLALADNFLHLRAGIAIHNNLVEFLSLWADARAGGGILPTQAGFSIVHVPFISLNGLVGFRWYLPLGLDIKPFAELGVGISYFAFEDGSGFDVIDFGPGMRLVVGVSL